MRLTKRVYGWPEDAQFEVPDAVLAHFRACVERGERLVAEWSERVTAYGKAHPDAARGVRAHRRAPAARRLGRGCAALRGRPDDRDPQGSQKVIQWAAERVPELVGGSADLAPSTLTLIEGGGSVERGHYDGRNLHFGVREHGMGAIVNGLTLHDLRGYGATFLIFSDYMKARDPPAALMRIPSIFVFTHDSIGLGEDGPTHQPIEQLAHAARDAEPERREAGRRQRDGACLAVRDRAAGDADRDGAQPPGPAHVGPGGRPR